MGQCGKLRLAKWVDRIMKGGLKVGIALNSSS